MENATTDGSIANTIAATTNESGGLSNAQTTDIEDSQIAGTSSTFTTDSVVTTLVSATTGSNFGKNLLISYKLRNSI